MNDLINKDLLIKELLWEHWHRDCEIIPDYIPPYSKDMKSKVVVKVKDRDTFLRYSGGPSQRYFWDCYGDDMITPELALIALSQAPRPYGISH